MLYNLFNINFKGGSSGIGAQTALDFAKLNASVAIVGRNLENLQKVANECGSADKVLTIQADVNIEEDVKRIIDETIKKFNKIDVL